MLSTRPPQLSVVLRCLSASGVRWVTTTSQGSQHLASHPKTGEVKVSNPATIEDLKQNLRIQFSRAKLGHFTQTPPYQDNLFTNNAFLTSYLTRVLPQHVRDEIWSDLTRFGQRAVTDIYQLGRECELNQPYVRTFDAWGNRTDELVTCQAWKDLKKISAEEGLIAAAYEGKYKEYDRLYQMVKLFIFSPVSGLYSCPLAMTDGAAKTARMMKSPHLQEAYEHLTSRDPQHFWTSGQWMTEKRGGSDVSGSTETVALAQPDGTHQLFGYKWFSSATDSDMTLTLANIISEDQPEPKSRGLTMFFMKTRKDDGKLNGIEIVKLKDKLGTRQLPTAELLLDGSVAHQVSAEGRGIASIANMLTITRMHNAMSSCAVMRRIIQLARDYSLRRSAFGQVVESHPLHQLTASRMEVTTRACEALTFHMARLLGREEAGVATSQESLVLRTLTPIMKFFTAKMAMKIISEALECFGGQGYIEDTGLPSHLRDAQVLPIWEGTTNIMSLDFLRAMAKSKGEALTAVYDDVKARIEEVTSIMTEDLQDSCHKVTQSMDELTSFLQQHPHLIQPAARDIATSVAHIYIGSLLLEHAAWEKSSNSKEVAKRWCQQRLTCLTLDEYSADNKALYMEGYNLSEIYGPMF
ncbi:acyl-CoA dehydrogenase family member 11-like [Homarus americanus]|uniref:acyl-CoA dehydrogenase family member 11-like n=1 Tax=Homarus americanus TaxID=6706 RepID=UPI001C478D99|nr:acyl-CoA dehydrogenase family member 11-like [Homarus americanus]XP_042237514.1 acyl-CoA dehydrogenase family member 11-like [Homarus americanus]XP_042237515.1 acyl-CoA dehydrogenase family member 11-like [Homarus americanus]